LCCKAQRIFSCDAGGEGVEIGGKGRKEGGERGKERQEKGRKDAAIISDFLRAW